MVLRSIPVPDGPCTLLGLTAENLLRLANGWPIHIKLPGGLGTLLCCALPTDSELDEMFGSAFPEGQKPEESAA